MTTTDSTHRRPRSGDDPRPLIAHIVYRLDVGGLETILVTLIERLPRERFRHVVICLADYTDFAQRLPAEVELFALHKAPGHGLGVFVRLWQLLRRLRPDVVHTANLAALECQPVAALSGVPVRIHAEHGWDMADLHGTQRKYQRLRRWLSPWVHQHLTVSAHLARYLTDVAGIPPRRVRHIVNGVDTQRFHPVRERPPRTAFVIGTIGRLAPVKNQRALIDAFAGLRLRCPDTFGELRLVVLGDGPEAPALHAAVAAAGIAAQTWMPGNRSDTAEQLRQMDLFVLPSLAEGIPVTVLEAMASGLPVVASRVGGLPELINDGVHGHLVAPNDAAALSDVLADYVRDRALARRHGAEARARAVACFDVERMVDAYAALFSTLALHPAADRDAPMQPTEEQ